MGQGLHGHHTTPSLIVSRATSPRHPTELPGASAGTPTGQTQQGPWAAGELATVHPIGARLLCPFLHVCACDLKYTHLHTYLWLSVCLGICALLYLATRVWAGGRGFAPDAFTPRTLSGVPAKSCWAITVGTYISPQGKAIRPNDETHQSSSQPCLTCPSVLFMVAYPWRKNAYGRGALWSPVGTCVHSQQWRAFKVCSAQLVQCTHLVGGCGLISLWVVALLCMHLGNYIHIKSNK